MIKQEKNISSRAFWHGIRGFSLLLLVSVCLIAPFMVSAQDIPRLGMAVSPQIFELDVFPGEERVERIRLTNKSEVALPIKVRLADFTAEDVTGEMLFDESGQDPSFTSRKWFKVENPDLILEKDEKRNIVFTISVPKDAEPGGHYSVMLFEPLVPSFYYEKGQTRAIPVIGVLFLFSVRVLGLEPETKEKLEIVEFSIPREQRMVGLEDITSRLLGSVFQAFSDIIITESSPQSFVLKIKNNDIYHIKPFGKVLIYNIFGKKVGEAEIPQKTILPGKIREFPVEASLQASERFKWLPVFISNFLRQNLFVGKYTARLELEAKSPLSAEILQSRASAFLAFFALPWKFWALFISLFGFCIFFMIKYRKRVVLALRVLIKK